MNSPSRDRWGYRSTRVDPRGVPVHRRVILCERGSRPTLAKVGRSVIRRREYSLDVGADRPMTAAMGMPGHAPRPTLELTKMRRLRQEGWVIQGMAHQKNRPASPKCSGQTECDHAALVKAVELGRITAEPGN